MEYTNLKDAEHKVELATNGADDAYLASQVTLPNVKKSEVGKFVFELNTANNRLYGPVEFFAYVVVDGKKVPADPFKLTISANVEEDFSALTTEQKQLAPIIELQNEYKLGTIAAGKNHKFSFPIKNSGVNPLEIRRIYSTDETMKIKEPKAIKSGKKGSVSIEISTKSLEAGEYMRDVIIITNDYLHPIQKVRINFAVE